MTARTTALAIAILTFLGLALFTPQTDSSQVITRLGLTLSIVESGTLSIDRYADLTIDRATFEGRYYSDKAPGLSLLGVPPVAAARAVFGMLGWQVDGRDPDTFRRYALVATLSVVGLISAVAAASIYLIARSLGASSQGAIFGSFTIAIGSPFFFWSTAFVAHAVAGSLILFALGLALATPAQGFGKGLAVGLIAGLAVVVEFTTALVLGVSGALLLVLTWRPAAKGAWGYLGGVLLGGLLGGLPLPIYNALAFGSPFHLGYMSVAGFEGMKTGFFGIGWPQLAALYEILFGSYRGLRNYAPLLVLLPIGLIGMLWLPRARAAAIVILVIAVAFLLINAGYFYWDGGWSSGPRHIIAMLPVLGVAMAFVWPKGVLWRAGCIALLVPGLVLAALVPTVTVFAPSEFTSPLSELFLPALAANAPRMAPMLLVWAGFGWLMWRAEKPPPTALDRPAAG